MEENRPQNVPPKRNLRFSDPAVYKISAERIFWNSVLEFFMEFSNTKIYQWIKKHPQLAVTVLIIWGVIIMATFFTFVIIIVLN